VRRIAIVTGSRRWADAQAIFDALEAYGPDLVVHGGARGADRFAGEWAHEHGVETRVVEPEPGPFAGKAPLVRNRELMAYGRGRADAGDEVMCFAFPLPGTGGTWDAIRAAKRWGVEVLQRVGEIVV